MSNLMDRSSLLDLIARREKKLKLARRFGPRLLATDPRPEQLWPALNHARRFVQPTKDGSGKLVEGGLDSQFLEVDEKSMSAGWVISAIRRDRHGDVVVPRGCLETLEDYQANPQVFFAHKSDGMPIGLCEKDGQFLFDVFEDRIVSRCYFHGSTEESDKVFDLVAKHILRAASIGFFPLYGEIIEGASYEEGDTEIDFDMGGITFQKWSIIEWSVVSVPANPDALRSWLCKSNLKSTMLKRNLEPFATPLKRNQVRGGFVNPAKGAIAYASHGTADESESWDAGKEVKAADVDDLKVMCAWMDESKKDDKSAYKLPHHRQKDKKAVWKGVAAAMSALLGGRGGVNIPEGDKKAVYNHLAKHYKEFGKEAPDYHKSIKAAGRKKFDVREQKLRPASVEIDFAAKHIGCKVKEITHRVIGIPGPKIGGFLCGWRNATTGVEEIDVRNLTYDGRELPPERRVIQLNSTLSDDFLVDGLVFYEKGDLRFVGAFQPTWGGMLLRLFTATQDSTTVSAFVQKAWDLAATEYNFLKGEAFSLSGDFIPKTKETFDDIFLTEKNSKSIQQTLKQLNLKGKEFANRGAIWMGPPGTGKTLSGRAIRNLADATFIWISAKDFYGFGSFGGFSYAYELAKELSPCVLFFEDIDNWMSSTSIDYLKTEMDGIGRSAGIWTILTTNFPQRLPEALIDRPGRFHDVLKFDKPDLATRKTMLKKWLPDLSPEQLSEVAQSTKGYSGAHLYELCHFARTLRDQEEKSLADAVVDALAKIAEQRELIDRTLRGEKSARPFSKSLQRFTYTGGRTRRHLLIPKEAKRMPALPQDPNAPDSPNGHNPGNPNQPNPEDPAQEHENEAVQAVLFHTTHFKSSDECITWLEENGFASDNLIPGDDADEPWVAIQFDADECEVDTARREEPENGVEMVCCVRKEAEGEENETPMSGESTEEQPQIAAAQAQTTKNIEELLNMIVDKLTKRKAAEPGMDDAERGMEVGVHEDDGHEDKKVKPHGAQVLEAMHGQMCALHDYMTEALQVMEHPQVKKAVEKLHGKLGEHISHVEETGAEHYPDHFEVEKHAADGDADKEDEEKEEEHQASEDHRHDEEEDLLHEHENEEHEEEADEEPEGGEDHQTPQGEEEDEEEDDEKKPKRKPKKSVDEDDVAIAVAKAKITQLEELIYALTGQEI